MPKYRATICQDKGFSNGTWLFGPIDLRKKYYFCSHCQGKHLTKEGLKKNEVNNLLLAINQNSL